MAMICAEALGAKLEDIKVHMGDTDHSPADLGAWGSRQTLMAGNATKMAAEDAKRQLRDSNATAYLIMATTPLLFPS
jgi:4-hydroxybenzoyl-CoA reductase subunit alpha